MNEREDNLFEEWWESEGQYHRAGGNDYCKTFAYHAWECVVNRQGYKLVPVEPTEKMISASFPYREYGDGYVISDIYKAMIGAVGS